MRKAWLRHTVRFTALLLLLLAGAAEAAANDDIGKKDTHVEQATTPSRPSVARESKETPSSELSLFDEGFIEAFCKRPAETVCRSHRAKNISDGKKIEAVQKRVRESALNKLEKKYGKNTVTQLRQAESLLDGLMKITSTREREAAWQGSVVFHFASWPLNLASHGLVPQAVPPDPNEATRAFLEMVEKCVEEEIGEPVKQTQLLMDIIRPALERAFATQPIEVENRKEIEERAKTALSDVKLYTPSEYLKHGGSIVNIRAFCGQGLLKYNAFFYDRPDDKKPPKIVVCPGVWLSAIAAKEALKDKSKSFLKDFMLATLSHELGHRIDYKRALLRKGGSKAYTGFARCVFDEVWKQGEYQDFVDGVFNEITADYWSAEVLAELVFDGKLSRADLVRILRYASQPYCFAVTRHDDPHAPGVTRIDIKGRNPRLREALHCSMQSRVGAPICALEGKVPVPGSQLFHLLPN